MSKNQELQDLNLDEFELDIVERMIAGEIETETVVGTGKFAEMAFGSLRDRVRRQSVLKQIDADVERRSERSEAQRDCVD